MLAGILLLSVLTPQGLPGEALPFTSLPGFGSDAFEPFSFVEIGDPQIGFGGAYPDVRRLERLAGEVQGTQAEFGIVVGDLVHDRLPREYRLLERGLAAFELPLTLIPGNHDVLDLETLAGYRRDFGDDYYAFVYRGCGFIALNSELLPGSVEGGLSQEETDAQWAWLDRELEAMGSRDLKHLFLVVHRPPGDGADDPLASRIRAAGIRHVLAGHLHATAEIPAGDDAFTVFTVGGTSRLYDDRGYGYRVFDVFEDRVEQRYVEFDRPSDHWLVTHGWTPRILDPSLPHWAMTVVFLTAAGCCWRAFRRSGDGERHPLLWRLLALGYLLLALNQQLDLDEIVVATGRALARALQAYGGRRTVQAALLGVGGLVFLVGLILARKPLVRSHPRAWLALVGFSIPAGSFLLHALSLHQVEALMYSFGRGGLLALETAGALLSCFAARR